MSDQVRVTGGLVRGRREGDLAVFRGIPFAAAPVGEYRFAAPGPVQGWDGVRPAEEFGPPPPQSGLLGGGSVPDAGGDEWLTVNVWTPDPGPGAGLPVMVWIHGGGYMFGRSGAPEYDGGHLARDGRVVVVTFNYRVGFEGFGHVDGAPENRGLLDQVAVLEWVRDNIAGFGGDPGWVTVFGESAGGGSVAALLAMPRAAGLFGAAIAQSVAGPTFTPELAADIAAEVRSLAEGEDPAELVAAGDLVAGLKAERWGIAGARSIVFGPVVDGEVLPVSPWAALAAGVSRDVVLLAGHTRDENRLFDVLSGPGEITDAEIDLIVPGAEGARRYREAYPQAGPGLLYELVHSDWVFRMPSVGLAEAHVAGGGRAYVYELAWPAPGLGGVLGACHGLDVPLVFGNLSGGQPALLLGEEPGAEAVALSGRMRAAWTSFANHGSPGWPVYTAEQRLTQVFDAVDAVMPYPQMSSLLIWEGHMFEPLSLSGSP